MNDRWVNVIRVLFSALAAIALVWVTLQMFSDLQGVDVGQRGTVAIKNLWMLIPVVLLFAPVILVSIPSAMTLVPLIQSCPEHLGVVATFCLVIGFGVSVLWMLSNDEASRKIFAEGIKAALVAATGAAIQHHKG